MFSIVKSVQANGTSDSPHGTLYNFNYEFEDGVSLGARHKTVTGSFAKGIQVEYEIKGSNNYGNYGAVKKPEATNIGGLGVQKDLSGPGIKVQREPVQQMIVRQSSLKIALEHLIFRENSGDEKAVTKENIMALAEIYTDYVFTGL